MILGFTGTRSVLPVRQRAALRAILGTLASVEACCLHHGDCIGADATAQELCQSVGIGTVIHPPVNQGWRAYSHHFGKNILKVLPPKSFLGRDRDIVDSCQLLIACPRTRTLEPHSGTWYTVQYARRSRVPVLLIYPDGLTAYEEPA